MRKVCIVTGARSEYGLLSPVMRRLKRNSSFCLQVVASAMHLSSEYGSTYREIERDGFAIDYRVDMLLPSDCKVALTKSLGLGVIGFAEAYQNLQPDLVMILGDRFEALAAAQAAMMFKIPIAHIHGGEVTEGAIDDCIRHAITKMSHLHFCAAEPYRQRLIQMGEDPDRVFLSGAPGIDNIREMTPCSKDELRQVTGLKLEKPFILVAFHPETLSDRSAVLQVEGLLEALARFTTVEYIVTSPNADLYGKAIHERLKSFRNEYSSRCALVESLGYRRFLSAMSYSSAIVGNSSSGIIEAPSFKVPTVNIGERQRGRLRALSVIDCAHSADEIYRAIERALSPDFVSNLASIENPFGDGHAAKRIVEKLESLDWSRLIHKRFVDTQKQDL